MADVPKLNITAVRKASDSLNLVKNATSKAQSSIVKAVYPVTECLQFLKNMYTQPAYKELIITAYAWTKLMAYIHLVGEYEVSGFGRIQNGKVTDFEIIRQEVKATYVESDADAVLEFIMNTPADQRSEWILDWHSHVNMATSPSTTDWTNYYEMLAARQYKQFPAMIVNKAGNVTANQIICENKHTPIIMKVENTPLSEDKIEKLYQICKDRVEHYCTKAEVTSSWSGYGARTNTSSYWDRTAYDDYNDDDYEETYNPITGIYKYEKKTSKLEDIVYRVNAFDLSEAQIKKMEAEGVVFDEETGEAYEEDECCEMCQKPLKTETELEYGVCFECFQKAMQEEALAYHHQNS